MPAADSDQLTFLATGDLAAKVRGLPAADSGTAKIQLAEQVTTTGEPWPCDVY